MKVLLFAHIPVLPDKYETSGYKGGTWIHSLLSYFRRKDDIDLAVCFHSTVKTEFRLHAGGITYYNIPVYRTVFHKAYSKFFHILTHQDIDLYLKVIDDFKPDVIQIFGTESGFGFITGRTHVPVIIHVQGLSNPILDSWLPQGINLLDIFFASGIKSLLLGNGFYHRYLYFKKQAKRELEVIKINSNFFSRTDWDKSYLRLLNPSANLFHCDEMIRNEFFESQWEWPDSSEKYIFTSLFNEDIYKGWDNILRIALALKTHTDIDFEWRVIGAVPSKSELRMFERKCKARYRDLNVVFKGKMNADEIINELLQAHVFLHATHIDNSPNSVCEAMMLGMPVICSEVGGCSSMISNNINGFLIHDNDPFYWASNIKNLLTNKNWSIQIGLQAREDAQKRHDPGTIMKVITDTYQILTR